MQAHEPDQADHEPEKSLLTPAQKQSNGQQEQMPGSGLSGAFRTCRMRKHLHEADVAFCHSQTHKRGAAWRGESTLIFFTVRVKLECYTHFTKDNAAGPNQCAAETIPQVAMQELSCQTLILLYTHTSVSVKWHLERERGHTRASWSLKKASF